jgi:L-idonate 5-dehydrogenase
MFQMGSASRLPHMHGAFCEFVAVDESQCHKVPDDLDFTIAAFAEPLSVALYAAHRAGNLMGQRVLITGAGPIGQLMALAAKRGGAVDVTMTDIQEASLVRAAKIGADHTVNTATNAGALEQMAKEIGGFDVAFEVSGAPSALNDAITAVHPGAVIVQVGTLPPGPQPILGNRIMGKELDVRGMHRFGNVFPDAVECLSRRQIDVSPILTAVVPMEKAVEAFKMAGDRAHHLKVAIAF